MWVVRLVNSRWEVWLILGVILVSMAVVFLMMSVAVIEGPHSLYAGLMRFIRMMG